MKCMKYRMKISEAFDEKQKLNESLQNHIDQCQNCHDFYDSLLHVQEHLSHPIELPMEFDRSGFTEELMLKLDRSGDPLARNVNIFVVLKWASVWIFAISLGVLLMSKTIFESQSQPESIGLSTERVINMSMANVVGIDQVELKEASVSLITQNPFDREYQSILAEANNVYNHLLACMPAKNEPSGQ